MNSASRAGSTAVSSTNVSGFFSPGTPCNSGSPALRSRHAASIPAALKCRTIGASGTNWASRSILDSISSREFPKYWTYITAPNLPDFGVGITYTSWRYIAFFFAISMTMSSTNSTALGPVESIAISGRRASGTPSNPKMARPRTLGRSTKESSASTVTPRVPSDPQNKCARLTRSKVPGVDARSCTSRMSRL